jgi:hypothetical protein
VNDVGSERPHFLDRAAVMAPECQIEGVMPVERKADGTPAEGDATDGALDFDSILRPRANY